MRRPDRDRQPKEATAQGKGHLTRRVEASTQGFVFVKKKGGGERGFLP